MNCGYLAVLYCSVLWDYVCERGRVRKGVIKGNQNSLSSPPLKSLKRGGGRVLNYEGDVVMVYSEMKKSIKSDGV